MRPLTPNESALLSALADQAGIELIAEGALAVSAGILGDAANPQSLISYIDRAGLLKLRDSGSIADGMLPKAAAIDSAS